MNNANPGRSSQDTSARPSATDRPEVVERAAQGAHETVDTVADGVTQGVKQAQQSYDHAAEKLQSAATELRHAGDEWTECLRVTVRENPLAAIGMSLAIGALIARLSR